MDDPLCFPVNISGGLGDAAAETWAAGRQGVMNSLGRLGSVPLLESLQHWNEINKNYLVVHPTNRKWVITPLINGISLGLIHL